MKQPKSLAENLLELGVLWQQIKHLDRDTRKQLLQQRLDEINGDDHTITNNNAVNKFTV